MTIGGWIIFGVASVLILIFVIAMAIDACLNGCCACVSNCVDEIEKLPSAELNVSDINVGDMINRQDAIDYCYQLINVEHEQGSDEMNYGQERVNQTETILHHLEFMPSAEPEIIRCKDCEHDCYCCRLSSRTPDDYCSHAERKKR